MTRKQKIISWSCFILAFLIGMLQMFYYLFLSVKGYEYIWDILPYLLNAAIIILLGVGVYGLKKQKQFHYITLGITAILLCIDLGFLFTKGLERDCIVSFGESPSPMVVKIDKDTRNATTFQKTMYLFSGEPQELKTPVNDYNITWMAKDIAVFRYQNKGLTHVYVIANGNRGRDSYYHPSAELQGQWKSKDKTMSVSPKELAIGASTFDLSNVVEVGKTAFLIQNMQGQPIMIVAYGDDLTFTQAGYIKTGSSVHILNLLDKNPKIMTFTKTSSDFSEDLKSLTPKEEGKQTVKRMKEIIQSDPTLAGFNDEYYFVKVMSNNADKQSLALSALKAFDLQGGQGSGCSSDVTLTSVKVTAGDDQDFFMEVSSKETAKCGVSSEGETLDITWYLRVMKADQGYLVSKTLYHQHGDYGLKKLKTPEVLNCTGETCHYFLQK